MGTLGKILLGVNILAAVGVAYLATQDYARHREVAGTAVQYQVLLAGLPVETQAGADEDAIPFPIETPGGTKIETISPERLKLIFQGYDGGSDLGGGGPVPTQMREVDRVEKAVQARLSAATPAEQLALLCGRLTVDRNTGFVVPDPTAPGWLLRMAESFDERDFIRELSKAAPAQVAESAKTAQELLDKRFAAVRAKPNPGAAEADAAKLKEAGENLRKAADRARQATLAFQGLPPDAPNRAAVEQDVLIARGALAEAYGALRRALTDLAHAAPRDEGDRRRRVAHLLMHLDSSAAWQKRVGLVTGLRTYLDAVRQQADRLEAMAATAAQQKVLDQARFSDEYELLKTLAVQQSLLLNRQVETTADLYRQRQQDLEYAKGRYAQLTARQTELAAVRAEVAETLKRQAEVEAALFDLQKRVGEALRTSFELEQKVEAAEQKKGGL
jgi:hypothetical protein